jgi:imidazolonepropionase-like amidohydrolase
MLVLKNAYLIDGNGNAPIEGASVLIDGKFIKCVGDCPGIPAGAEVFDLGGRTVFPGLTEAHIHMGGPAAPGAPALLGGDASGWFAEMSRKLIDFGVTNVRSGGDYENDILRYRAMTASGAAEGPRVWAPGKVFQPVGGHPAYTVWNAEPEILKNVVASAAGQDSARAEVRRQAALGVDHIKCFLADDNYFDPASKAPKLDTAVLAAIADEAHKAGLRVMVHCQQPSFALEALNAGADTIEHFACMGHCGDELPKGLVTAFMKNSAFVVPTLAAGRYYGADVAEQRKLQSIVVTLFELGVKIAAGTDTGTPAVPPGEALHTEMEMLVEAGLPPMDAIIAATRAGAELVGSNEFGTVEPGKLADLVVVDGNPLQDIRNTRNIRLVMKEGRILRSSLAPG